MTFFFGLMIEGREGLPYGYRVSQVAGKDRKKERVEKTKRKEGYTEGKGETKITEKYSHSL
jgi:hypothetical protein